MNAVTGERLVVVGAGTMGAQIALQSARHGVSVSLVDVSSEALERGMAQIEQLNDRDVAKGRRSRDDADLVRARIVPSTDLSSAAGAGWAIEAVVERADVKASVMNALAEALPDHAGLASNSSHIPIGDVIGQSPWGDRAINMHFFHPVVVMDLVEVVVGPRTREDIVQRAMRWCEKIGRTAVLLRKPVDGFLVNRISSRAQREAFVLNHDGFADFVSIDRAIESELGWPLGPFKLGDLSGLDVRMQARQNHFDASGDSEDLKVIEILRPYVEAGRLGRKSGQGFYDYGDGKPTPLPQLQIGATSTVAEVARYSPDPGSEV